MHPIPHILGYFACMYVMANFLVKQKIYMKEQLSITVQLIQSYIMHPLGKLASLSSQEFWYAHTKYPREKMHPIPHILGYFACMYVMANFLVKQKIYMKEQLSITVQLIQSYIMHPLGKLASLSSQEFWYAHTKYPRKKNASHTTYPRIFCMHVCYG